MAIEGSKNVLMIAYQYPPVAAGGVCRTLKFSRFLPQFGWCPHVLTVSNSPESRHLPPSAADPAEGLRVCRTCSFELDNAVRLLVRVMKPFSADPQALADGLRWRLARFWNVLSAPDPLVYWAIPAVPRGLQIMLRHRIDALYSTSWPYSDHLAALMLHSLTGKPWVADFRDPFTRHFNYGAASSRKDRFNRWLEAAICRHASFVVSPTQRATEQMRADHPEVDASHFTTIPNGFDDAEFTSPPEVSDRFEILHSGSFYLSRRPDRFLQATEQFLRQCPRAGKAIQVTFMGLGLDHSLSTYECYPFVTARGWCTRDESIRSIRRSPVLLLIRHPECGLTIPGKLYEYMASGNHIVALTGRQPEIIRLLGEYGNATVLPDPSPAQLVDVLETLFRRWEAGDLRPAPMTDFVRSFSRRFQTAELARLLNLVAGQSAEAVVPAEAAWTADSQLPASAAGGV